LIKKRAERELVREGKQDSENPVHPVILS